MSETFCDVSLDDYDGDEAAFYNEAYVKARKAHVCHECREAIEKGQSYHRVTGKWDGDVCTYRFCRSCWEVMGEFSDGAKTFGVVWDTFINEWASGATLQGCLNRLESVAAKSLMTRQWRRWKKLEPLPPAPEPPTMMERQQDPPSDWE